MTINILVSSPTLPTVYDGFGYSVDLYNGIINDNSLDYAGTTNAGGSNTSNYTFEVLDSGNNPVTLSTYGLELTSAGKIQPTTDGKASFLSGETLSGVTIKITDNVAVDNWTSPAFDWVFSTTPPSLPSLASARNWTDSLRSGVELLSLINVAEDCVGRMASSNGVNDFTTQTDFHGIPVRRGAVSGRPNVKISDVFAGWGLYSGDKDATIAVHSDGYVHGLHFTSDNETYVASQPELMTENANGNVWCTFAIKDWRSIDPVTGVTTGQGIDAPYDIFLNLRMVFDDNASTEVDANIQIAINETASVSRLNFVGTTPWELLSGTGATAREVYTSDIVGTWPNFNETTDTDRSGANNDTAVYADTNGENTFILVCFCKGVYQNPAGNKSNKIKVWFGGTKKGAPFEFYLPLHANNQDNTAHGIKLNSGLIHNANFYSAGHLLFTGSQWADSRQYNAAKEFAISQWGSDKNLPDYLTNGGGFVTTLSLRVPYHKLGAIASGAYFTAGYQIGGCLPFSIGDVKFSGVVSLANGNNQLMIFSDSDTDPTELPCESIAITAGGTTETYTESDGTWSSGNFAFTSDAESNKPLPIIAAGGGRTEVTGVASAGTNQATLTLTGTTGFFVGEDVYLDHNTCRYIDSTFGVNSALPGNYQVTAVNSGSNTITIESYGNMSVDGTPALPSETPYIFPTYLVEFEISSGSSVGTSIIGNKNHNLLIGTR